ncbi:MAG: ABC transporter permease [Eubacteriales bacterium]|nr:ABC transporter permease [Eubacteriales bacterium]
MEKTKTGKSMSASAGKEYHVRIEAFKRGWYKFSRNPMSMLGLFIVAAVFFITIFCEVIAPYGEDAGLVTHMAETFQAPSLKHICGTDDYGRDVFSRILIGFRPSLAIAALVLGISVPLGVVLGLIAGYYHGTIIDTVITRIMELFMSIPPLILAMVVCCMFSNNYISCALGIAIAWWPWYTKITYNLVTSLTNELYITYTTLSGISMLRIIFSEMLPNLVSSIITKMTLDTGSIILTASSMSFVGLGVQPPTPSLGSMVSDGIGYLPEFWWLSVMPAIAVIVIVMGFNLLGDGLTDVLTVEDK